ncbi:hypothetical protein R1sor_023254 [Riccia sorocarpa]|uniref:Protein kinase domain-containing protein n=1 Tax=Riccia sorocarpa TaxID=122646 RepID=A0ABD3GM51_9MARC
MASRGHGAAGGRGNRERDDRGKRPMVDPDPIREPVEETDDKGKRPMVVPDPICEPVEETLEEGELAPIIIGQPTAPSTQVEAGEGSSAGQKKKKKKKTVSKESHEASRARSEVNHHIRHAWFKWFAENAEHRNTFKLYNTLGTSMGVRRLVEHLCKLGRQTYEGRREIAPALPPFDTAIKTRLEVWAESVPYKRMDEYKIWIKTKVFKDWSDASYERMRASHIAGRFATDEGKAWLVKKIEMWERWLNASKPCQVKFGSFSWKMKGCEPISNNQLRWITLKTQISDLTRKIGQGSYGSVYLVGFRDVALGLELGMEGVVPYVAKKCDEKPPYSAWVMMHKELASFAETHCAIVRPIACHNIEAEPILVYHYWNSRDIRQWKNLEHTTRGTRLPDNSGRLMNLITDHSQWFRDLSDEKDQRKWKNVEIFRAHRLEIMCTLWSALEFMHENDWLHCDIHVLNVFLHFPNWDYEDGQEEHRMPTWEDERSLVFAALGDLGMAQQVHVAASVNGRKYPRVPKKERDWIAPELVDSKIQKLAARNIHIHPVYEYNKATDVYALGVLTHQVCGDFFTDMTMPERIAYKKKYYALGAPKDTDPAGRNEILLKDLIKSATHHHAHMRTSAAQGFEVMSDNMKINPMTCSRPTETPSQQRRERTNVYEEYLNAERVNMAYGLAYQEMRQLGLLLPE